MFKVILKILRIMTSFLFVFSHLQYSKGIKIHLEPKFDLCPEKLMFVYSKHKLTEIIISK